MGIVRLLDCGRITISDVRGLLKPSSNFEALINVLSK